MMNQSREQVSASVGAELPLIAAQYQASRAWALTRLTMCRAGTIKTAQQNTSPER